MAKREHGAIQPGIRWGPFTLRLPFLHYRLAWPEFAQGIPVAAATGLALVPVFMSAFGLTFEEAVSLAFFHALLISAAPIVFGEPFASGWITPALPFALTLVLGDRFPTPAEKFQVMAALSIDLAILLLVLGLTGLGQRLIDAIPRALKGAIIMGAAIAALKRVFFDDATRYLFEMPVSMTLAIGVCLILTFSIPIQRWKTTNRPLAAVVALGFLPGMAVGGIVGTLIGELHYVVNGQSIIQWGFVVPTVGALLEKVSPFGIGFPPLSLLLSPDILSLAFVGYVILFGDLITGIAVLRTAIPNRPDERIDIDANRTHLSAGIRNALMALFVPFFPTQGVLWTGVHVIVVNRWSEGRKTMDSLFSGIGSYYQFGIPILYLILPVVTMLRPLLPIALALTLVLTGFACAFIAMEMAQTRAARGTVVLSGVALALFDPWIGLLTAATATLLLLGWRGDEEVVAEETTVSRDAGEDPR